MYEADLGKPLEQEILEEKIGALHRITDRMLIALGAYREAKPAVAEQSQHLLEEAAEAVWFFIVQREIMGLSSRSEVLDQFDIPPEIRRRIGPRRMNK